MTARTVRGGVYLNMRRAWLAAAIFLALAGCASAPVVRTLDVLALAAADARFLEGCYGCLLAARDEYARLAQEPFRTAILPKLFEAELLIASRERELALDDEFEVTLQRARVVAAQLPAAVDTGRYLQIVEAIPADGLGWPRAEIRDLVRANSDLVRGADDAIEWLEGGSLRSATRLYLALAIDCSYIAAPARRQARADLRARVDESSPPLVVYRAALCSGTGQAALEHVRTAVPQSFEAAYALGRLAISQLPTGGGARARDLVAEALQGFPESPAARHLAGNYYRMVGDCAAALRFYDKVLATKPRHEDVWLGRTICLTMLGRRDEAIAAATHMLDREMDNPGEPLYWRAWNYRVLGRLDLARDDIDRARSLRVAADVLTLAGMIEHDQDDLDVALRDLTRVRAMPRQEQNCAAVWYWSSVQAKRSAWAEAAPGFEAALACYERSVAANETALDRVRGDNGLDPAFRANQIAALEQALRDDQRQVHASAMNAAKFFAVAGDLAKATALADRAAADPLLADDLAVVRDHRDAPSVTKYRAMALYAHFDTTLGKFTVELFEHRRRKRWRISSASRRGRRNGASEDRREAPAAVLRRHHLPSHHRRLHDPGWRSARPGPRRSRVPVRG